MDRGSLLKQKERNIFDGTFGVLLFSLFRSHFIYVVKLTKNMTTCLRA